MQENLKSILALCGIAIMNRGSAIISILYVSYRIIVTHNSSATSQICYK